MFLYVENMQATKSLVDFEVDGVKYCVMKSALKSALKKVERWQYISGCTDFGVKLIGLIAKADDNNKRKFLKGFPEEVCAYFMWFHKRGFGKNYTSDNEFFTAMYEQLEEK